MELKKIEIFELMTYIPIMIVIGIIGIICLGEFDAPEQVDKINLDNCDMIKYKEVKYPSVCDSEVCCKLSHTFGECTSAYCEEINKKSTHINISFS